MNRTATTLAAAAFALPAIAAEPLVSPAELSAMMEGGDVAVIDIRSSFGGSGPEDYAAGHIPGAAYAGYSVKQGWMQTIDGVVGMLPPVETIEAFIAGLGVDADETVVIVGSGEAGKPLDLATAARVYWTFKTLGHDAVSVLDGGHAAWVAAGLPVSDAAAAPARGDFEAALRPEMIATDSDAAATQSTPVALIDARGAAMFTGEKVSGKVSRGGALPGAVNLPYVSLLNEDKTRYQSPEAIRAAMQAAGVASGSESVVYCNIGLSGALGWFALNVVAGEEGARLYDGSAAGWTIDPKRPTMNTYTAG